MMNLFPGIVQPPKREGHGPVTEMPKKHHPRESQLRPEHSADHSSLDALRRILQTQEHDSHPVTRHTPTRDTFKSSGMQKEHS